MNAVVYAREISKAFGRHVALDKVTIAVMHGETLGLIGANGAGKTTLLRILAGLLRPATGEIAFEVPIRPGTVRYFGGERTLPPDVRARNWHALWDASAAVGTTTRRFGLLSRGTRQRIGLDAVLGGGDADLLLLDEPWEGLDPDASRQLSDALIRHRAHGAGIIVSSHRIHDLAAVCDRCEFLVGGRLASPQVMCAPDVPLDARTVALFKGFDRARQS